MKNLGENLIYHNNSDDHSVKFDQGSLFKAQMAGDGGNWVKSYLALFPQK